MTEKTDLIENKTQKWLTGLTRKLNQREIPHGPSTYIQTPSLPHPPPSPIKQDPNTPLPNEKDTNKSPETPILSTTKAKNTSWPHAHLRTHTYTHSRGRWALPVLRGWLQLRHSWGTRLCHAALVVVGTNFLIISKEREKKIERYRGGSDEGKHPCR